MSQDKQEATIHRTQNGQKTEEQKKIDRMLKFGTNPAKAEDLDEKLKKRQERFGITVLLRLE